MTIEDAGWNISHVFFKGPAVWGPPVQIFLQGCIRTRQTYMGRYLYGINAVCELYVNYCIYNILYRYTVYIHIFAYTGLPWLHPVQRAPLFRLSKHQRRQQRRGYISLIFLQSTMQAIAVQKNRLGAKSDSSPG